MPVEPKIMLWLTAVASRETDECIDWPFGKTVRDYGRVSVGNRKRLATHVVLELSGRPRPPAPGDRAKHSCDRPPCCNPRHLSWGTQRENVAEREQRGRHVVGDIKGTRHPASKLTDDDVRTIRALAAKGATQRELAKTYGIAQPAISRIINRKRWAHLD